MGNIMDLLSHFTFLCFSFVCMGVRVSHVPQRVCVSVGGQLARVKCQVSPSTIMSLRDQTWIVLFYPLSHLPDP